jgi:hypothetical protein
MKSGRVYNKAMLAFLAEHYPKMFVPELTAAFNKKFRAQKTAEQIKACLSNHGIKAGVRRNRTPRRYEDKHLEFLQKHYLMLNLEQLTDAFNANFKTFNADVNSIRACLRNHKIKSGRTGHFEPGQESWNKGKKGLNTGGEKGWFKKGAVPINYKPVGSERVNADGYVEVKVSDPNKWALKHRIVYQQHFGDIPKGHNVSFRDNNPLNIDPSNLILISKAQNAIINKMKLSNVPAEAKDGVLLIADLTMAINKKEEQAA